MTQLAGRVALITGAGHGQGAAAARLFAREGAAIAVADLDEVRAKDVAAAIEGDGGRAVAIGADVSDEADVVRMVATTVDAFAGLHVLYNNAGVLLPGTVEELDLERWERQFRVNVGGVFLCSKHALPHLRRQGGAIINTASTAGVVGEAGSAGYCATKGAIVNLTRAMALDHAREGIRVNCICPGWIDTGFNDPAIERMGGDDAVAAAVDTYVPMGRQGSADEVASVALFLASDSSSLMTGAVVTVDAGLTAM
jgi:NAD(P)-dependent dehydrogenase (short-subunit alcohol dehydrogenase family)